MSTPLRGRCVVCSKMRRLKSFGMCTVCHIGSLDVNDGESPGILTGRWVPHPSLPIRVYVEDVSA